MSNQVMGYFGIAESISFIFSAARTELMLGAQQNYSLSGCSTAKALDRGCITPVELNSVGLACSTAGKGFSFVRNAEG